MNKAIEFRSRTDPDNLEPISSQKSPRKIPEERHSPEKTKCNIMSRQLRSTRDSTYFLARALAQCLGKNQLSQKLLAERTLLDTSKISRLVSRKIKCSPNDLARLIQAFPNPQDKADLILAHISDSIPSSAFNFVSVGRKMDEAPRSKSDKVKGVSEVSPCERFCCQRAGAGEVAGDCGPVAATSTRRIKSGWLVLVRIQDMSYITDQEGARVWERANAGEFMRCPRL